ncbi:MAG: tetratricopeptide (TPR) repeat protein [Saprospiraceae bacterium]
MKSSISVLVSLALLYSSATYSASISTAKSFYNKGDLTSALEEVSQVLKGQQTNPDALFLKAQLQNKIGSKDKAISTYQLLIEHHPTQLEAYNNLAAIFAQRDNLQAASEVLEKAMRVDPVYATIYNNLRAVYWDMSRRHVRAALKLKSASSATTFAKISSPLPNTTTSGDIQTAALVEPIRGKEINNEHEAQVAAALTPAKKVEPKPEPKPTPELSDEQQVAETINDWSKAWSDRNALKYVAAYTSTYRPTHKKRSEWVTGRRWNFKSKKFIKIKIDQLQIVKSSETYVAKFRQSYQSDLCKDKVLKELNLTKQNGTWKISKETTLKAL